MLKVVSLRVTGYRRAHARINDAQLFTQVRTLRISQFIGFDCSTGRNDLADARSVILADAQCFS